MDFMLSRATRVTAQWASAPVQHAVARFWRDMEMTLSTTGFVPDNRLMICLAPALPPESYTLDVTENQLTLCAADDLGAVYGLLDISRHYLGVAPFWFWNQQQFEPKPFATVPEGRITGPAAAVGLRGWDLSDAPWLSAWADATENGWEMIFESLLRYRGNMVRTDKQADLAAAMGLRPVQNPQTPLGAAPQQAAAENPEERHKIWQDSIRTLKTSPRIWALGIDGMGGDPDGTASTAALQEQWQLLNATVPGAAAYILLQGETVALYQEGKLKIPDSVIPVLTPAPSASSAGGPGPGAQHGLWFSLCRRDKLTGNPMTAYPGGDTAVNGMLQGAWRGGVRSFWMVGTGDLRPSLMELNLTGALWCTPDTDCAAQRTAYLRCTYRAPDGWALTDSALEDLSVCLRARAESAVQAGSPPQPVGEAFLTRSTRLFASAWLCGKTQGPIQELAALLPAESYAEQLAAYQQLCISALENYETLLPGCSYAGRATTPLWQEQVVFSVRLYLYALRGAVRFCTAREQFLDKDWQNCFCTLGRAADDFGAMAALLQPKTGFWAGFCSDTMLDGALTARVLTGLMAIPRAAGDGPDYTACKTQGPIQELAALLPAESYAEQLAAYQQLCISALENYETLLPGCSYAGRATTPLWQEQVVFSVRLYLYALRGAVRFCTAREQFLDKDWQNCFCTLGRAADDFGAMAALLQPKTGFWAGFCSDTMLDGALTARVLTGLMAIPRAAGDGPDYTAWQAPLPGAPAAPVPDFTLYRALVQAETKKV